MSNRQSFIPGTEPPDVVQVVAIDDAIEAWHEAKRARRAANDDVSNTESSLLSLLAEHKLDRYPYTDPEGKKRAIVVKRDPRAVSKADRSVTAEGDDADDWSDDQTSKVRDDADDKVESRRVSRASVEPEIDPFASTRGAMAEHVAPTNGTNGVK